MAAVPRQAIPSVLEEIKMYYMHSLTQLLNYDGMGDYLCPAELTAEIRIISSLEKLSLHLNKLDG